MRTLFLVVKILVSTLLLLPSSCSSGDEPNSEVSMPEVSPIQAYLNGVPALIDLGSNSCVPCQMMEGELEKLDSLAGDMLDVQILDVNENTQAASDFGIRVIPTQIFFSETGEELYRHEGFFSYDDIMSRWNSLGYTFE